MGFETARELAMLGATVILACRSLDKAYRASGRIVSASRNPHVFADKLDLASLDSIESFAERFIKRFDRLDILVNNAGEQNYTELEFRCLFNRLNLFKNRYICKKDSKNCRRIRDEFRSHAFGLEKYKLKANLEEENLNSCYFFLKVIST